MDFRRLCECGDAHCDDGQPKCRECLRVKAKNDAIDESLRKRFKPEDTMPMFADPEEKK
jgi:hypothetical protein